MSAINTIDVSFLDSVFSILLTADVYDTFQVKSDNVTQDVTTSDQFIDFLLEQTYSEDNPMARNQAIMLYDVLLKVWDDYKKLDDIDSTIVEIVSIDPIVYVYNNNGDVIDSEKKAIASGTEHIYSKLYNINKGITEVTLNDATVGFDYFDISLSKDVTTNIIYNNRSFYFNIKGRPERKSLWKIDLNSSFREHNNTYKKLTNINLVNLIFPFQCVDMRSPSASFNNAILSIELETNTNSFIETHTIYNRRVSVFDFVGTFYNLFMPISQSLFKPNTSHTFRIYLKKDIQYPPYGKLSKQLIGNRTGYLSTKQYNTLMGYLDYNNIIAILLMFDHLENNQQQIII